MITFNPQGYGVHTALGWKSYNKFLFTKTPIKRYKITEAVRDTRTRRAGKPTLMKLINRLAIVVGEGDKKKKFEKGLFTTFLGRWKRAEKYAVKLDKVAAKI